MSYHDISIKLTAFVSPLQCTEIIVHGIYTKLMLIDVNDLGIPT